MTNDDKIEFVTKAKWKNVIPEPVPAHQMLPDWYQKLPLENNDAEGNQRTGVRETTVKGCIPFLEAMKAGWILKTPADISITQDEDGFTPEWEVEEKLMSPFSMQQVGNAFPESGPLVKFNNFWRINAPEGYSMLQIPPMNRPSTYQQPFISFSGIISIDEYHGQIHSPALWLEDEFDGVIPYGTPLSQIIIFKRDGLITNADAKVQTKEDYENFRWQTLRKQAKQRMYRDEQWHPIPASRVNVRYEEPEEEPEEGSEDTESTGWQKHE